MTWVWNYVSAYRLTSTMLQDYFAEKYGNYQFPIEVSKIILFKGRIAVLKPCVQLVNDHFRCWIPENLGEVNTRRSCDTRGGINFMAG